ncbi:MAG: hypothetical protein U9R58_09460 [Chloroflexota bacterium]|nr:hypothetical protein [Chloroflexota bacterium]
MDLRILFRNIFSPRIIAGAVLVAILLLVLTFTILWLARPGPHIPQPATAVLNVIRAPTATQPPPEPTSTSTPDPTLSPDQITVGILVQVSGTGGEGLRLRVNPGLGGQIWQIAQESDIFLVEDGPRDSDNYRWWFLVSPDNETSRGWAVADFIKPISNP